jgi:methylase of polypeptide subunit release factors
VTLGPIPDKKAAAALGAALRKARYSEDTVLELLGEEAYSHDRDDLPVDERRLPKTHAANLVRALFLQVPVATADIVAALGRRAVDALAATGLAEVDDELLVRKRVIPVGELFVASDDNPQEGDDPPDFVAAYTSTSRLCDCLTPRSKVKTALDVGTGSGVQALLAARHARHVIATDVNPRALAYTELNAALNGLTNIEVRRGSFFDAVAGERFDLITCNAPYVVSPENRWTYRDSGLRGDEVSERVVRAAADHLAEGGFATLLVSWVGADEDGADERPLRWAKSLRGCDSWILSVWEEDPLGHAETWNKQFVGKPAEMSEALDSWTAYMQEIGAGWVSEGAYLLHRRPGRRYGARVDGIDDDGLDAAGGQVKRAFASRERLAGLDKADDLLREHLALAMKIQVERELAPRRSGNAVASAGIQLLEGTNSWIEAPDAAIAIVETLDGTTTLRKALRTATPALRRDTLRLARDLLELGALRFS